MVLSLLADPCDKCNTAVDQGGCKCDSNCNCLGAWGGDRLLITFGWSIRKFIFKVTRYLGLEGSHITSDQSAACWQVLRQKSLMVQCVCD